MFDKSTLMLPNEYQIMFEVENAHWWYRALSYGYKYLRAHTSSSWHVLDAGCGTGANLNVLDSLGYRLVGFNLSFQGLRHPAAKNLKAIFVVLH
jgi:SAM-dependent methyltransferase